MREFPFVDETRCTAYGDCVKVCPTDCLEMAGNIPWLIRPGDCISCAACVAVCAPLAISLAPLTMA